MTLRRNVTRNSSVNGAMKRGESNERTGVHSRIEYEEVRILES